MSTLSAQTAQAASVHSPVPENPPPSDRPHSIDPAELEIALWFKPEELVDWKRCTEDWSF